MPGFVEQLGMQAASGALGAGMGLILQRGQDKRQLKQQKKLQALEIAGQQQMTDYNMKKQLEMWEATNYKAQMEQLKKAGLNPALLYGMSGGGGATTNIEQGNVSGTDAPRGGGEALTMGMGMQQAALTAAQVENIKAQTQLTKAQTQKTSGVDTDLASTTIDKLKQDIKSQQVQNALTEVQTALASIQEHIAGETQNMEISKIASATRIIANDATISDATRNDIITTIKRESLQVYLENQLLKSQKTLTDQQVQVAKTAISKMINDMVNDDKRTSIEDLKVRIMENQAFRDAQDRGDINIDDITKNVGVLLNPANILKGRTSDIGFKIPQKR